MPFAVCDTPWCICRISYIVWVMSNVVLRMLYVSCNVICHIYHVLNIMCIPLLCSMSYSHVLVHTNMTYAIFACIIQNDIIYYILHITQIIAHIHLYTTTGTPCTIINCKRYLYNMILLSWLEIFVSWYLIFIFMFHIS